MLDVVISDMAPRTMGTSLCRDDWNMHIFSMQIVHISKSVFETLQRLQGSKTSKSRSCER